MKINKYILHWISGGLMSVAFGLAITGCTDDFNNKLGIENGDLGQKVHGTISVNLSSNSATTATRAWTDFSAESQMKIDNYWVGIYDSETGELLGSDFDTPRKSDNSRYTLWQDSETSPFTVDVDINYYEHHPEAIIVGVINYGLDEKQVQAKNIEKGEIRPLIDLLNEATSFSEFCKISVDVKSVEAMMNISSNGGTVPLMMGFYSPQRTAQHTTVSNSGQVSQDAVKISLRDATTQELSLTPGAIRLQRLVSQVNMYVMGTSTPPIYKPTPKPEPGEDYPSEFPPISDFFENNEDVLQIESLEYKVVNNPTEVFLAEHTTDYNAFQRTDQTEYLNNTANSADFLETGGYVDVPNYQNGYYDGSDEGFRKVEGQTIRVGSESDYHYMYVFPITYQHYENKHYGDHELYMNGGLDPHSQREAKWENGTETTAPVFKSLCPSEEYDWNNNASYIILKAKVHYRSVDDEGEAGIFTGDVYYTIHEGYTRPKNQSSQSPMIEDYQSVRNTSYYYSVMLTGIDQFLMNVGFAEYDEEPDYNYHDDGISGDVYGDYYKKVQPQGESFYAFLPALTKEQKTEIEYLYGVPKVDESNMCQYDLYGTWTSGTSPMSPMDEYLPDLRENVIETIPEDVKKSLVFYKSTDFAKTTSYSLEEYLNDEDFVSWTVEVEPFDVDDENSDNLDILRERFFLFYLPDYMTDNKGSELYGMILALIQPAQDYRVDLQYFGPANLQSFAYSDDSFNVYSSTIGMSDKEYIRWWAGGAQYEDNTDQTLNWNDYPFYGPVHEPLSYTITIDGSIKETVNKSDFDSRRHSASELRLSHSSPYFINVH